MRYVPYAHIIGGTSGGGGGMPMSYEMPNGWMVRLSSVRMYDRDKKDIENGIEPDIPITMTSSDQDDIIEQAILTIRLQKMEKN
jgi:C-terminal processing protease CtpA/Prc